MLSDSLEAFCGEEPGSAWRKPDIISGLVYQKPSLRPDQTGRHRLVCCPVVSSASASDEQSVD
jgi:hypothetical protein